LSLHRGSLEEAFIKITGGAVEYSAGNPIDNDRDRAAALVAAGR
jgi:hypothetical protein